MSTYNMIEILLQLLILPFGALVWSMHMKISALENHINGRLVRLETMMLLSQQDRVKFAHKEPEND